jgi:uroporphyrin-III C-methyltransferase
MMARTSVYLVGSGPGPADLLTLRAAKTIANADVLIYDALVSKEVVALAVKAQKIAVGKRSGQHSARQIDINTVLIEQALIVQASGKNVVRLKGGDPLVFGRAEEEIEALNNARISFEVLSGITSAQAAHASIKTPLTRRGQQRNFVLATPQVQQGDLIGTQWARPIVAAGCGAIYMAASAASRIKGCLLALGMAPNTPVTWVADAGHEKARHSCQTLQTLAAPEKHASESFHGAQAPYILLVGAVPNHYLWNSLTFSPITSPACAPSYSTQANLLDLSRPEHLSV